MGLYSKVVKATALSTMIATAAQAAGVSVPLALQKVPAMLAAGKALEDAIAALPPSAVPLGIAAAAGITIFKECATRTARGSRAPAGKQYYVNGQWRTR